MSKHDSDPFDWTTKGVKGMHRNPWKDISFELPTLSWFTCCFVGDA